MMMLLESSLKPKLSKSLVIGIHDWRNYLSLTLPSIERCSRYLDEIIFVLDRLNYRDTNRCCALIKTHLADRKCDLNILFKEYAVWQYRPAETFSYGFKHAKGDLLYVSAEDIILDPVNFKEHYWMDPSVGVVDFRYYNYDPHKTNYHVVWDSILLTISDTLFGYGTSRSGILAIRRSVYDQIGGFKDQPSEQDILRNDALDAGFTHHHVKTSHNYHLRPGYDKRRQLLQGQSRREQGFSLKRTIAHSVLHVKPWVLKGYLSCGNMD